MFITVSSHQFSVMYGTSCTENQNSRIISCFCLTLQNISFIMHFLMLNIKFNKSGYNRKSCINDNGNTGLSVLTSELFFNQ